MKPPLPIDRRELLALGVTTAVSTPALAQSIGSPSGERRYGRFEPLTLGAVKPKGWLRAELLRQSKGVTSNLQRLYHPFSGWAWIEDRPDPSGEWWPWEVRGYWADGSLRCAALVGDEKLFDETASVVRHAFRTAQADGYIGPSFLKVQQGVNRWPHVTFFRAAMALHDLTGDPAIVDGLRRHYLGSPYRYFMDRDACNIEAMLWTYDRTGESRLLDMASESWRAVQAHLGQYQWAVPFTEAGMLGSASPAGLHGVTYAEFTKLPALLFRQTGDARQLAMAANAHDKVFADHLLPGGAPSTSEVLSTVTSRDAHELCNVSDFNWTWGYLMMATGNGAYGDRIERSIFNALPGSIRKDWKALQYYSSPNQCLCDQQSDHVALMKGTPYKTIKDYRYMQRMSYRPSPGYTVVCCPGNLARALPTYVERMWMTDRSGGLVAALHGPSEVTANVGGASVRIEAETDYPYGEVIRFKIAANRPVRFPLKLRLPAWCRAPAITVNGASAAISADRGFATIAREWRPGDIVELRLPMEVGTSEWPDDGIAIERGPLVYSLPIGEDWTRVADERSSDDFPAWDAAPRTRWNYGLLPANDSRKPVVSASVSNDRPWADPPTRIQVAARRVEGWDLERVALRDERYTVTPPLPDPADLNEAPATADTMLTLVPMASTQLRITVFPRFKTERPS